MAKKRKTSDYDGYGVDYDEFFACIVGFTSGGAPYGITWEELGREGLLPSDFMIQDHELERIFDDETGR